ncbi:hypothetical protein ElyMa_006024400 [Elysia marginata]|uniref:Uncharacterized protein n=1 Tax=Elysia marginata TaxID=1093978 RepID=A0AAV4GIJ5_9GAST|nr:hypothetical protein ElyMa_006024400 [Elysia marginata]
MRAKHKAKEQAVIKAVRRKRVENAAAQQELQMKAAASRKQLIEDVLTHAGPCKCHEDVKSLQSSLSGKDLLLALKNEIRYQKLILGIPGVLKLTKPTTELTADLPEHLGGSNRKNVEEDMNGDEDMFEEDED